MEKEKEKKKTRLPINNKNFTYKSFKSSLAFIVQVHYLFPSKLFFYFYFLFELLSFQGAQERFQSRGYKEVLGLEMCGCQPNFNLLPFFLYQGFF